jgi:hypothetical protein
LFKKFSIFFHKIIETLSQIFFVFAGVIHCRLLAQQRRATFALAPPHPGSPIVTTNFVCSNKKPFTLQAGEEEALVPLSLPLFWGQLSTPFG